MGAERAGSGRGCIERSRAVVRQKCGSSGKSVPHFIQNVTTPELQTRVSCTGVSTFQSCLPLAFRRFSTLSLAVSRTLHSTKKYSVSCKDGECFLGPTARTAQLVIPVRGTP